MENYLLLFTDRLVSSLILPIHQGFVLYTMLCFRSHYNPLLILLFGVLGSSLGGIANWYLGRITIFIRRSYHKLENEDKTPKIVRNLLICTVALFSWTPALGSVIEILSGYFKLNLYILVPLIILSNFLCLLYLIFTI
ncbi:Inner membrane protein YqaA [Wolbachia endosymbiont of Cylisticus convexus]|uniref:DedA family protein n=1 Tax=Wolbachia endosymbiont of Armadillidium arcangelii TaxID=3158571 RepID=A0AAU7Q2U6_9RICK|nr:Inner membrane protein YqaA [Armadillidium vulgare] [Wolbachia endosymbiont of Armadillidium vulgare]OJH30847.1 Inner membrane protein YqaA [Wolbachia endosymbiont of Armadillidium vulgare]OJH31818.1 Inner membrane protein YqaA [Wolbachia endosymbiont of Armadillidium vulgare]RDD35139.1 Inner membrane protein YqaA [Wolbachia endosymbiont of Cylisticus convexus]